MSSEEQRAWIYAVVGLVVPAVYLTTVLSKVPGTDVATISYVRPMLIATAVAIGASIVLSILTAIFAGILTGITSGMAATKDLGRTDERDRAINRRGEYAGFYVMSIASLVPLGLALAEAEHFWIANSLYLAFVLAALTSAVVRIVAYRRG
ncbi:hypothetical protein [Dactylosporangium sp. CS-033363]|uniref:hypothetical protein n=1 Tax=Dactylosporangium sp. CS-033363 TaxID=3239935 RepID=UPI003D949F3E